MAALNITESLHTSSGSHVLEKQVHKWWALHDQGFADMQLMPSLDWSFLLCLKNHRQKLGPGIHAWFINNTVAWNKWPNLFYIYLCTLRTYFRIDLFIRHTILRRIWPRLHTLYHNVSITYCSNIYMKKQWKIIYLSLYKSKFLALHIHMKVNF